MIRRIGGTGLREGLIAAVAGVALLACASAIAAPAGGRDPRGMWQGKLMEQLRIVFHVDSDSTGGLKATLDSPDQGARGLPVGKTTFANDTLRLELQALGASFAGRMSEDGARIEGEWRQSGQALPLVVSRADSIEAPRRPQEPKRPYPYEEEDVRYPGGSPDVSLAGTLTKPIGPGPFPCALLITGSGPQDRDETVFGQRPFLIIADHLTRAGIAVLRVDDRGVAKSTGSRERATSADFADDVRAGVRFLKARPDVDPKRIGLIGHSEGGLIAPMVAAGSSDIAFVVMLAGPGVTGDQILYAQGEAIARVTGKSEADVARERRIQERLLALTRQKLDSAAVVARVRDIFTTEKLDSATAASQLVPSVAIVRSPWMRYFIAYDPRPALRRVRCPVLAMNGEKDVQVPPKQNLPEIEKALKAGGNRDFSVREMAGLNHLFQHCKTCSPTEYGQLEETFAPAALDTLTTWLEARVGPGR